MLYHTHQALGPELGQAAASFRYDYAPPSCPCSQDRHCTCCHRLSECKPRHRLLRRHRHRRYGHAVASRQLRGLYQPREPIRAYDCRKRPALLPEAEQTVRRLAAPA